MSKPRERWGLSTLALVAVGVIAGMALAIWWSRPILETTRVVSPRAESERKPVARAQAPRRTRPSDRAEKAADFEFPAGTVRGEMVLTFASEAEYQAFLRQAREAGISGWGWLPRLRAVRLGVDDLALLGGSGAVADFNYVVLPPEMPERRPEEEGGTAEFGSSALEWLGGTAATATWGEGILIALLDTGVAPGSPVAGRLAGMIDVTGDGTASADSTGHGTAIATLLLGEEGRVEGVAPGAKVLSVRVIGNDGAGDSFALAQGIVEAVDRGARVLSISLGSFGDSAIVRNAVAYAQSKNAAIVAAVGNESGDMVAYPARYEGVIGVTATDARGQVPSFSNRGPEVDIAAPGVGVLTRWDPQNGVSFTGTSAAVPFVSGTIAGLMSQNPSASAASISGLITSYGNDAGPPGTDPVYGAGLLNFTRLLQRNTTGVQSLAVADVYANRATASATNLPVVVTVQNRGTLPLNNVLIETNTGGVTGQKFIQRLAVGETGSTTVTVPAGRSTSVSATARSLVSGTTAPATTRTFSVP